MGRVISRGPQNILSHSIALGNAYWTCNGDAAFTSGQSDPRGGTKAFLFSSTVGGWANRCYGVTERHEGGPWCLCFRLKAGTEDQFRARVWNGTAYELDATFNLATLATTLTVGSGAVIRDIGNSFYECYVYDTNLDSQGNITVNFYNVGAGNLVIYCPQMNQGAVPDQIVETREVALSP